MRRRWPPGRWPASRCRRTRPRASPRRTRSSQVRMSTMSSYIRRRSAVDGPAGPARHDGPVPAAAGTPPAACDRGVGSGQVAPDHAHADRGPSPVVGGPGRAGDHVPGSVEAGDGAVPGRAGPDRRRRPSGRPWCRPSRHGPAARRTARARWCRGWDAGRRDHRGSGRRRSAPARSRGPARPPRTGSTARRSRSARPGRSRPCRPGRRGCRGPAASRDRGLPAAPSPPSSGSGTGWSNTTQQGRCRGRYSLASNEKNAFCMSL